MTKADMPAFPCIGSLSDGRLYTPYNGLTLRQYYVGQILGAAYREWCDCGCKSESVPEEVASAYEFADAAIAYEEREK
jgi:hypothetical protein